MAAEAGTHVHREDAREVEHIDALVAAVALAGQAVHVEDGVLAKLGLEPGDLRDQRGDKSDRTLAGMNGGEVMRRFGRCSASVLRVIACPMPMSCRISAC